MTVKRVRLSTALRNVKVDVDRILAELAVNAHRRELDRVQWDYVPNDVILGIVKLLNRRARKQERGPKRRKIQR